MAITKLSTNGIYGDKYGDIAANNNNWYESIQTTLLGSTQSSITFTNIPQDYTHLQLRGFAGGNNGGGNDQVVLRFNSDSSNANYTTHYLQGNGSSASAYGFGTGGFAGAYLDKAVTGDSATTFGTFIVDLLDYKNTSKFKTMRSLQGYDSNGSGVTTLQSSVWLNTNAITSITIVLNSSSTYRVNSRFSLYGLRA